MPVRNAADTLETALSSIEAQTMQEWELIAIADRCDDKSPEILEVAAASDPRVRILRAEDPGLVAALNAGIANARAPLIARFDADDECERERLEQQVQYLRTNLQIGACGSLVRFGGNPFTQLGYALHVEWINSIVAPEDIALNRFIESPVAHPSMMFRSELVQRHGGYRDGPFPEDYELWLRWMDAGAMFGKVPQALLTWNDPPGRLSRTDPRYSPEAFYECKCHYLARWLKRERPKAGRIFLWGAGRPTRKRFATLRRLHRRRREKDRRTHRRRRGAWTRRPFQGSRQRVRHRWRGHARRARTHPGRTRQPGLPRGSPLHLRRLITQPFPKPEGLSPIR